MEVHDCNSSREDTAKLSKVPSDAMKETDIDANFMLTAKSNGIYVDLNSRNIKEIPATFYAYFNTVKYLYLEGNRLEELPQTFFPSLTQLKWLDVRNNFLITLPTSVSNHPNLETLLLRGNKIKVLPLELGLVPKLKGLQLQGNPVQYPPCDVVSKGVQFLLQFLRQELDIKSPSNIRPIAEPFYENTKHTAEKTEKRKERQLRSKSCVNILKPKKSFQYPPQILELKSSQISCVGNKKPLYYNDKARPTSYFKTNPNPNLCDTVVVPSNDNVKLPEGELSTEEKFFYQTYKPTAYERKLINHEAKVQDNFLKSMWISKLRDMLDQQEKILQRRKDQEVLKDWRLNFKKCQQHVNREKHDIKAPYDINFNLTFDGTEKPRPQKAGEILRDIGDEMADIFRSLQSMSGAKIEDSLPSKSKQMALDMELKQLAQLQQKLSVLKKRNTAEYKSFNGLNERPKILQARKSAPNI